MPFGVFFPISGRRCNVTHCKTEGICEMGISDADTAKNPKHLPFVRKKKSYFANA